MVRSARLERATHGLEGRCSIQLSYERKFFAIYKLYKSEKFLSMNLFSLVDGLMKITRLGWEAGYFY